MDSKLRVSPSPTPRTSFLAEALGALESGPKVVLLSGGPSPYARFHAAAWGPRSRWRAFPADKGARVDLSCWQDGGWAVVEAMAVAQPVLHLQEWLDAQPSVDHLPRLAAGAFGYFNYECGRWFESFKDAPPLPGDRPIAEWIAFDSGILDDRRELRRWRWGGAVGQPFQTEDFPATLQTAALEDIRPTLGAAAFQQRVLEAQQAIAAGEIYQINLSIEHQARLRGDPLALWLGWYAANPAAHYLFFDNGQRQVLSTSPETFLLREGYRLMSRPIKGTRPRSDDPAQDSQERAALESSEKERAELTMIVDLVRNDLGRVGRPGSVRVIDHGRVESYRNVHHRVATIVSEARDGTGLEEALAATFPAGSITGCPKIRAMEWISRLEEGSPRGLYCGSLGWLGGGDNFALSVAIRTVEVEGQAARFRVGSGIVADSNPVHEEEETRHKARTFQQPSQGPYHWLDGDLIQGLPTIPETEDGLFETLLSLDGHLRDVAPHHNRFFASALALDLRWPRWDWAAEAERLVRLNGLSHGPARVRVSLLRRPNGRTAMRIESEAYVPPKAPWRLWPVKVTLDEAARHKRLDRRVYQAALVEAQANGADEAVLINEEGFVCEGARTAILWWEGDILCHPDPALLQLPSVTAARFLEEARVAGTWIESRRITWNDLRKARQVLVCNALIGAHPARTD